jgi:hypothetical protein
MRSHNYQASTQLQESTNTRRSVEGTILQQSCAVSATGIG